MDEVQYIQPVIHTMSRYMPPHEVPKTGFNAPLESLKNKNYFITNPEFFSMDDHGQRVDTLQLCFSNKELRKELTANIEANIKEKGGQGIVELTCNDYPGRFCWCPECARLEEKLGCTGGPLFDYLIELCGDIKAKYPDVMLRTYAYRESQSQKPPKVQKLPDNLIIVFAPVDNNFSADWNHPSNLQSRRDLQRWCEICQNVWVWYYVLYENQFPVANTQRLINDMRLMKKLGVQGLFLQLVDPSFDQGFSELQIYLALKLLQSVDQDTDALISEFMNYQYGSAAYVMRRYHNDLEKSRKELRDFTRLFAPVGQFRYLTAENLFRWERDFDEMEQLTKDDPARLFNVRQTRLSLDIAVLQNWPGIKKEYPEYFNDAKLFEGRIRWTFDKMVKDHVSSMNTQHGQNVLRKNFHDNLDTLMIFAENPGKPLPAQLAGIPQEMIHRVVPAGKRIKDVDAAFGLAAVNVADKPFKFGFYDARGKNFVMERMVQSTEIKADSYELYKLGTVELTQDCYVWFAASGWFVQANLSKFYEPGAVTQYEVYASLKFEGPSYSKDSRINEDRVLCDQVILVKPGVNQGQPAQK